MSMNSWCNWLYVEKLKWKVLQEKLFGNFPAWMETLELLRSQTLETPMLVWNDVKRMELKKVRMAGYRIFPDHVITRCFLLM